MDQVKRYINKQPGEYKKVCERLQAEITKHLSATENKVWHGHPVWFIDGNPIAGYSIQKAGVRLMFWSGVSFDETGLNPGTGKYKDASIFYQSAGQINSDDLARWCEKARHIQWDYKNIIKNKGKLNRLNV